MLRLLTLHPLDALEAWAFCGMVFGGLIAAGAGLSQTLGWLAARGSWAWLGRHPLFRLFGVIVALGIPVGLYYPRFPFISLLATAGVVWFAVPSVVVVGIVAVLVRRHPFGVRACRVIALAISASSVALGLAWGEGTLLVKWEIAAARQYVARVAPLLDQIKVEKGSYPASLPVSAFGKPPALLQGSSAYSSDGAVFRFYYPEPWTLFGDGPQFDSDTRTWQYDSPFD